MRYRLGVWGVKGIRLFNELASVQDIPTYNFVVALPKKKYNDY